MKKLFIAVFAALALTACVEKIGPELTTPPVFSDITFPAAKLTPTEEGSFKATLTSPYGLQSVKILYFLDERDETTEVKSVEMKFNKTIDASATTQIVEGRIPVQKNGTKVTYQLLAWSYTWVGGASAVGTYIIEDTISPLP